ncbi:MAG: hypothetical protein Q9224_004583, partial [Gallowayella concinna]
LSQPTRKVGAILGESGAEPSPVSWKIKGSIRFVRQVGPAHYPGILQDLLTLAFG